MVANLHNLEIDPVINLDASQQRLFDDDSPVIVVNWHRQKGKDFTAAAKATFDAFTNGSKWYIVSLTQRQADATFSKCRDFAKGIDAILKAAGIKVVRDEEYESEQYNPDRKKWVTYTARKITFSNGGEVHSLPGKDPDTLAGLTGNVIFTEFGLFPNGGYDHWRVVYPLTTRGFQCIIISTPRGKNTKFYEMNQSDEYSLHFCDIHQSVNEEGFELAGGLIIEEFKKRYADQAGFEREYECKFTGNLDALIKYYLLQEAQARGTDRPFNHLRVERELKPGWTRLIDEVIEDARNHKRLEIGWDIGRKGDLTSVWVNIRQKDGVAWHRLLITMKDCEFSLQREVLMYLMDNAKNAVGCGDATGLGMDSNETLKKKYKDRWQPVAFSPKSKGQIASTMLTAYIDGTQTLSPDDRHEFIVTDLFAIQRDSENEKNNAHQDKTIKIIYGENELLSDSHCDIAVSNGLALLAGQMVSTPVGGFVFV